MGIVSLALPEFNLFGDATPPPPVKYPVGDVYHAYTRAGGKLTPCAKRALGQQARILLAEGKPLAVVVKVAREMGRDGTFAGHLGRLVREVPEPCVNGSARARLTLSQLERCPCAACAEWAAARQEQPLAF